MKLFMHAISKENLFSEAATDGVLLKKLNLRISQNPHGNICAGVTFETFKPATLLKSDSSICVFLRILQSF